MRFISFFIAMLLVAPSAAWAAPYVLDKSHAHVTFTVSHLGFSYVHGQFRNFDAAIDFDPGNVEATRVAFTIDATSVDTLWEARDKDLRSKNFLNVAVYPTITFNTTGIKPVSSDSAEVTGDLTIIGVTRPVTLMARLNKIGPSPFNPNLTVAGFSVEGEIDRTAFGMTYAAPAIGSMVKIRLDLEMSPVQ